MDEEILRDILNHINLNDKDINYLINSKFKDNKPIFDEDKYIFLYDFCGKVKKYGSVKCMEYIHYLESLESWTDKIYLTNPNRTLEDIDEEKLKFRKDQVMPSLKGLIKCKRCGSDNILENQKVYRADEEAIRQLFCMNCKSRIR